MIFRLAILTFLLPYSAAAQTVVDAARSNFMLATKLCLDAMLQRQVTGATFPAAGFTYRRVDHPPNSYGITPSPSHYFDTPANTVHAKVMDPSGHGGLCSAYSLHLTEADATRLVGAVIAQLYPNSQPSGATSWSVRNRNAGQSDLPLIVTVRTVTRNKYEAAGTIEVSMSFPG